MHHNAKPVGRQIYVKLVKTYRHGPEKSLWRNAHRLFSAFHIIEYLLVQFVYFQVFVALLSTYLLSVRQQKHQFSVK